VTAYLRGVLLNDPPIAALAWLRLQPSTRRLLLTMRAGMKVVTIGQSWIILVELRGAGAAVGLHPAVERVGG